MKKINHFLLSIVFLIMISGKMMSQTPDSLPLYQEGKLYLQLKLNSNVSIQNKDTVVNDPGGGFKALFIKYQVVKAELPFASLSMASLSKNYRITFSQAARVDSFIIDLSQISSHVQYSEKVPAVYTFSVPNDPMATSPSTVLYHLPLLNANQASNIHISNGNAVVAIVDDAILTTHQDLASNIGVNTGTDVADADPNPNPPLTGSSPVSTTYFTHGTHVAGIAGAVTNNSIGIASIGWNNKLMCVKTCSDNSNPNQGLTNAYDGLAWAAVNGGHVINMSWGSFVYSQTDYNVVVAAKNSGVVLVAAAGNSSQNLPMYPAAYGEGTTGQSWEVFDERLVVAVAALDQNNDMSIWGLGSGSNFGNWVDISAYGTNIMSTLASSTGGLAIINQYGQMSGTSMAAPMVAGIAGVMRSYDMSKTADEIIDCLLYTANPDIYSSSHPLNQMGLLGKGRADAEAALRCISTTCSVNPIAIIVPSSPNLCANATLTLTANQGAASYAWNTGATTSSIVVSTAGIYSVTLIYPNHCSATASINFSATPTLSLSLSTNTSICSGYSVNLITASGNYNALTWQPGGMTTPSVVVNPTVYTVYSVTANQYCGGTTATIGVNPGNSQPPFSAYSVLGSSLAGNYIGLANLSLPSVHYILSADATVNTFAGFHYCEVLIGANVKITVPAASTLNINLARLKACGTDMWKGIILNDGSQINTDNQSIIEDAITAISSTHTPLSSAGLPPARISNLYTLFNKNYIDISLTNYYDQVPGNFSDNDIVKVIGCVFTCRNFLSQWPSAGFGSAGSYALGVRTANSSTTSLASPYLWNLSTVTNLKAPYNTQPSHIAINLSSVGITTGLQGITNSTLSTPGITIGDGSAFYNFNLFDTHGNFIVTQKSNVNLTNNVFQNTQTYTVSGGSTFGGSAITHSVSNVLNTALTLTASNKDVGNRFWDCHMAIDAKNVYRFSMEYCTVRSTQSYTANQSLVLPGNTGVNINTNRFDYYMANNEFTNIKTGINIPVTVGSFTPAPCFICAGFGVYANRIRITNNTFGTGTVTNSYMDKAVNITGFSNNPWSVPPSSVTPFTQGLIVTNNTLTNIFRGINITGVTGVQVDVEENSISLKDETSSPTMQYGVTLNNAQPASSAAIGKNIIASNTVSFSSSPTNTLGGLIFCGQNGISLWSPSVTCNNLQQGAEGFVFNGTNNHAVWAGNILTTPLKHGLALTNTAVIGAQGGTNTACSDQWVGGTGAWTGSNFGTYIAAGSTATNSILYVKNTSSCTPPNADGPVPANNYNSGTGFITFTVGGDYTCSEFPNNKVISLPRESDYANTDLYYMDKNFLYRFLHYNDSIRSNNSEMGGFYSGLSGSSIDKFMQVEDYLYKGYATEAAIVINGMDDSGFNTIETNYQAFYNLYINYLNGTFTESDGTALYNLAVLCPGDNGTSVYQAIALYNSIFNQVLFSDCSGSIGARTTNIQQAKKDSKSVWNLDLFPNPATNQLTIVSKNESEVLLLTIKDLSNRLIETQQLKTNNFFTKLDLILPNGVYLISINNSNNEKVTKKLIIAK